MRARPTLFASPDDSGGVTSAHGSGPLDELFAGRHLEPVLGRIVPPRLQREIHRTTNVGTAID